MKANDLNKALAELSASIKPKTGKSARDEAESASNGIIEEQKTKLKEAFTVWLHREILEKLPTEAQLIWRNYLASVEAVRTYLDPIGPQEKTSWNGRPYRSNHASEDLSVIDFPKFVTGYRYSSGYAAGIDALSKQVRDYDKRKKALAAKIAELDSIKQQVKAAIWRTYKSRAAVTTEGVDLRAAVKELVSGAIGVPLLAAPVIEPELVTD